MKSRRARIDPDAMRASGASGDKPLEFLQLRADTEPAAAESSCDRADIVVVDVGITEGDFVVHWTMSHTRKRLLD